MKLFDRDHIDEGDAFGVFAAEEVKRGNLTAEYFFASLAQSLGRLVNSVLSSVGPLPFLSFSFLHPSLTPSKLFTQYLYRPPYFLE